MHRTGKYNARKTTVDGITFDSKMEASRYGVLVLMQRAGLISGLRCHPVYELQPAFEHNTRTVAAITYEGDFEYLENGVLVCEDVKGVRTPVFNVKAKMFLYHYPDIDFRVLQR